jgi:hypothetical protein
VGRNFGRRVADGWLLAGQAAALGIAGSGRGPAWAAQRLTRGCGDSRRCGQRGSAAVSASVLRPSWKLVPVEERHDRPELRAADNGGRFGRGAGNVPNHSPVVRRLVCTPCGGARETGCASPGRLGRNLRQGVESRGRSRSGSSLAVPGPPVSRTRGGESGITPQRGTFVPRWADVGPFLRVTIPGA